MGWQRTRLEQIENNLRHDLELLAGYEAKLRVADDPRERLRYQSEIDRLKSTIAVGESERQALLSQPPQSSLTVESPVSNLARVILTREGREMVLIPPGVFRYDAVRVAIDLPAYYTDRYPVTNGDYQRFLEATERPVPRHWSDGNLPQGKERHPVVGLTYSEALSYAQWTGKRLPTEEEWEKAARGTDGRLWPWGHRFEEHLCNSMWKLTFEQRATTIVGSFSPRGDSPYGVSDVGRLWEWTSSWFAEGRYKAVKGGPWRNVQEPAIVINRSFEDDRAHDVGFRCVCEAENVHDILVAVLNQ
jgi:formylglycine-generating enzyme required for sulfatase activity